MKSNVKLFSWLIPLVLALFLVGCAQNKDIPQSDSKNWNSQAQVKTITVTSDDVLRNNEYQAFLNNKTNNLAKSLHKPYEYKILPGDVINVIVWGQPDLNNPDQISFSSTPGANFTVDPEGDIYYAYVGRLHVEGLDIQEAQKILAQRLSEYVKNPAVTLTIAQYVNAQVDVIGAVNKPQRIPLIQVPLTLTDVITQAEGANQFGNLRNVILKRNSHAYKINLVAKVNSPAERIIMKPGDVVYVSPFFEMRVYVMGEIMEPRVEWIQDDKTNVLQALSDAKGLEIPRADHDIYVLRLSENKPEAFRFDIAKPAGMILASQFNLRPNDIVYVGSRGITKWNDVVEQLLPTFSLLSNVASTGANSVRMARDIKAL
ncbi:polysaccharide biosynthesis/export family protein [Francisellaceae bacterium]|nr:polysaccharide biosynthesis/export family protein [Francisellaceae bacterium]